MPLEGEWIIRVLSKTKENYPNVPSPVWTYLDQLIRTKFSRKQMTALELAKVSQEIIDLGCSPPTKEGEPA